MNEENENLELDLSDAEETEVTIEQETDTVESAAQDSDSDDYKEHETGVQKRIDKLTRKMREAERREQAAIEYARNVQNESNQLKAQVENLDTGYLNEYGARVTKEQESAEQDLRRAVDVGDSEAVVNAQRALMEIAIQNDRYQTALARKKEQEQYAQQYAQQAQPQQPQQPQHPQQPQQPDPKATEWAEKNTWFGKDDAMTFATLGLHRTLVEKEGFDPQSDDYYNEMDNRIRIAFPHKFTEPGKKPAQTVVGVSRTPGSGRTSKVRLSRSQVAIAKKLGVPLEEYAKYVKE